MSLDRALIDLQGLASILLTGGYAVCLGIISAFALHYEREITAFSEKHWAQIKAILTTFAVFSATALLAGVYNDKHYHQIFLAFVLMLPCAAFCRNSCKWKNFFATAVSGLLCASLYYFTPSQPLVWLPLLGGGLVVAAILAHQKVGLKLLQSDSVRYALAQNATALLTALAALAVWILFAANTGQWVENPYLLHHWSVYVEAGKNLLSGYIPFYEFPVQYGFGPMLLNAGLCAVGDCWQGFYYASIALNVLYALSIFGLLKKLSLGSVFLPLLMTVVMAFVATTLWVGFPAGFLSLDVPSTGGLRFLPLSCLMLLLLHKKIRAAYFLLAISAWYSPEALLMGLMVLGLHETHRLSIGRAAGRIAITVLGSAAIFVALYGLIWRKIPDPLAYAEYLIHVPGVLRPNISGVMWALLGSFVLGIVSLRKSKTPDEARDALVSVTGLMAASLYCLGRSHDQNMLNVMPFLVVVVCVFIRHADPNKPLDGIWGTQMVAAIVAVLFFIGWEPINWEKVNFSIFPIIAKEKAFQEMTREALKSSEGADVIVDSTLGVPDLYRATPSLPLSTYISYSVYPARRRALYLRRTFEDHPDLSKKWCLVIEKRAEYALDGFDKVFSVVPVYTNPSFDVVGLSLLPKTSSESQPPCRIVAPLPEKTN